MATVFFFFFFFFIYLFFFLSYTVPEPRAIQRSASELLNEHNSSLPLLGRGSRPGDHVDLFSPPNKPSFAKVLLS